MGTRVTNYEKFTVANDCLKYTFPCEITRTISFGSLFPKVNLDKMNRKEVDDFICALVQAHPYIYGAMELRFSILRNNAYYHILNFKNYEYNNQKNHKHEIILSFEQPEYIEMFMDKQLKKERNTEVKTEEKSKSYRKIKGEERE